MANIATREGYLKGRRTCFLTFRFINLLSFFNFLTSSEIPRTSRTNNYSFLWLQHVSFHLVIKINDLNVRVHHCKLPKCSMSRHTVTWFSLLSLLFKLNYPCILRAIIINMLPCSEYRQEIIIGPIMISWHEWF